MVDFFEDLGRKISDVANDIGKKTEDTIEIQKLKSDMRTLRRANDRDLMDMGRMVYDKFVQGEISDPLLRFPILNCTIWYSIIITKFPSVHSHLFS